MAEMPVERLIRQIEAEMDQLNQSVRQLKDQVETLTQENNRLRMRQYEAIEAITLTEGPKGPADSQARNPFPSNASSTEELKGKARLQSFYDEGIHVCHPYFGTKRDPHEACIFCQDILDSLGESS
ncbi:initiation control protein YabA [Facklamia languida]